MKAFIINGSARRSGSTAILCECFSQGFTDSGGATSIVCLGEAKIAHCRACDVCRHIGKCATIDDMQELTSRVLECDVLVMASPSYWGDVTAQMKTFIDRSLPMCEHVAGKHVGEGKVGVSIAVRAGTDKGENLHLVRCFEHYFGHLGIAPAGTLTVEGVSAVEHLTEQHKCSAFELGREIGRHHQCRTPTLPRTENATDRGRTKCQDGAAT